MSEHTEHKAGQPAPAREPMSPDGAQAVRAYAARKREQADQVAAVLEDLAENGLPTVEDCRPWEDLREAKLAQMHAQRGHVA
ncbi:ecdysteroid 22-kinase family protein [Streptomyces sp. YS415]|uniref:ecdysteroid 22-kinase family protein n=1 Tax=Streptomyces sp. YS415 TaxID=2944806 RepID=UPI0020211E57|nr:ecdysteroid 22-kinase family protein [Streptomyces sp. YS415]MCL7429808.1 ecdysteroid 22-kinase family protein [Streptomyces sp. YS415]